MSGRFIQTATSIGLFCLGIVTSSLFLLFLALSGILLAIVTMVSFLGKKAGSLRLFTRQA